MVKTVIALIIVFLIGFNFFNGYQWYCNEMLFAPHDIFRCVFSVCTLTYMLNGILMVGILKKLSSFSYKTILIIVVFVAILKILLISINVGLTVNIILQASMAYSGNFIGFILGVFYFKRINKINAGLFILVIFWFIFNILYPFIA